MTSSENIQVEKFKIHLKFGLLKRSFSILKPKIPGNPCDIFREDALNLLKQTYSSDIPENTIANMKYFLCFGSNAEIPVMKEITKYDDLLKESCVEIVIWPYEDVDNSKVAHRFKLHSSKHPVWCINCNEIIWNFSKRSYKCSLCKICAHKRCAPYVTTKCKEAAQTDISLKSSKRKSSDGKKTFSNIIRQNQPNVDTKNKVLSWETDDDIKENGLNNSTDSKNDDTYGYNTFEPSTQSRRENYLKNIKFTDGKWEGYWAYRFDKESKRRKFKYEPDSHDLKIYFENKGVVAVNTTNASLENLDSDGLKDLATEISKKDLITMIKKVNDGFGMLPEENCKSSFSITEKENSIQDFEDLYEIDENDVLGAGRFGKVYGGFNKETKQAVAIKKIFISGQNPSDSLIVKEEAKFLFSLHHPGILRCEAFFHRQKYFILVTERLQQDMLEYILHSEEPKGRLTESCTKYLCYQILIALRYLHKQNIAHCDLKPENVLLEIHTDIIHVKIADFGYARVIRDESVRHTLVGTPAYLPPEVFNKNLRLNHGYNRSLDIWSFGVITYVSLCGYFPYRDDRDLLVQIKTHTNLFSGPIWEEISIVAKNLIGTKLLVPNAGRRIISQSLIYHEWFTKDKNLRAALIALEKHVGSKWLTDVLEESSEESASD